MPPSGAVPKPNATLSVEQPGPLMPSHGSGSRTCLSRLVGCQRQWGTSANLGKALWCGATLEVAKSISAGGHQSRL